MSRSGSARPGLTRTELVVLMTVSGLAFSLLIIALSGHRQHQFPHSRTTIMNHIKQMALACHAFHDVYKQLPPAFDKFGPMKFPASIHVHLLPYIEQDNLYKKILQDGVVDGNAVVSPYIDATLRDHDEHGVQNNAANLRVFSDRGRNTAFDRSILHFAAIEPGSARFSDSFPDGTSTTIILAQKHALCGEGGSRYDAAPNSPFAAFIGQNPARVEAHTADATATFQLAPSPPDCRTSPLMAQSYSQMGITVGLADAVVRFVSKDVSPRTWNAAMHPSDGLKLDSDW